MLSAFQQDYTEPYETSTQYSAPPAPRLFSIEKCWTRIRSYHRDIASYVTEQMVPENKRCQSPDRHVSIVVPTGHFLDESLLEYC